jgi:hypothetical protein
MIDGDGVNPSLMNLNISNISSTLDYSKVPKTFSYRLGYPSLLPLAFGMIPKDSPQYKATIHALNSTMNFNSLFGISSISRSDSTYLASKDSYWRGPVWVNMNYLVLRGLKLYYP